MIKKILQLAKIASCVMLFSTFGFSQTIINNGFGGTNNYTFSGLYTPAPPVLDGDPSDACWSNATLGGETNSKRIVNGVFPETIAKINNLNDDGRAAGTPPAAGALPSTGASASFSTVWDQEYFYFIVKVVDPRVTNRTTLNGTGVELFFNNGTARSSFIPGASNFPRKYDNAKDMQIVLNYSTYSINPTPIVGADFANYGIPLNFTGYNAVAKGTTDGYVIEGRVSWKVINTEFIDPISDAFTDLTKKPLASRIPFGFDVSVNVSNDAFSDRGSQLMWNQCCWNTNWTQSQHFGVLTLAGAPKLFTATGVTIAEKNNGAFSINTAGTKLELKATVLPADAPQNIIWTVQGNTNAGFPIASIDQFGVLTPLNSGQVTVTASTFSRTIVDGSSFVPPIPANTFIPSVISTQVITISNQVAPTAINITAPTIDVNWGTSLPSASALPANAPSLLSWSMIDPGGLAVMNTLTGEVTSKSINNGSVTIVGTSLANGILGYYTLPLVKQSPVDCFALNAYSNINQTLRTKTNLTFSGFNSGAGVLKTKIRLIPEYVNQYVVTMPGVGTVQGNLASTIPDDLVTITGRFSPANTGKLAKSGAGWEISFDQNNGSVTLTGIYLNNTNITSRIIGVVRQIAPTTATGCGYDVRNSSSNQFNPGCNSLSFAVPGLCVPTDIDATIVNKIFQLYPNPASELITISADGIQSVSVLSLVGSEVLVSNVITDNITLSTSSLSSGVYLVKVKLKGGQVSTQKLIISK